MTTTLTPAELRALYSLMTKEALIELLIENFSVKKDIR